MAIVLEAFKCALDGFTAEDLQPGDERDFGGMADGLRAAGLIGDDAVPVETDGGAEDVVASDDTVEPQSDDTPPGKKRGK